MTLSSRSVFSPRLGHENFSAPQSYAGGLIDPCNWQMAETSEESAFGAKHVANNFLECFDFIRRYETRHLDECVKILSLFGFTLQFIKIRRSSGVSRHLRIILCHLFCVFLFTFGWRLLMLFLRKLLVRKLFFLASALMSAIPPSPV